MRRRGEESKSPIDSAQGKRGVEESERPEQAEGRQAELRIVALRFLREGGWNPRRHYDEGAMAELVESVRAQGVLVPLLVRRAMALPQRHEGGTKAQKGGKAAPGGAEGTASPQGAAYEVVSGSRRLRAAREAGLEEAPCIVREMDDDTAATLGIVDNLIRRDIEPLEEAEGFAALLTRPGWTIAEISARVGKSLEYVAQRLKLGSLIEAGKVALAAGELLLGQAVLIARLGEGDQANALRQSSWLRTVAGMAEWIENNVLMRLGGAFGVKDADLLPAAGACVDCAKRTGAQPELWPEIRKGDRCLDRTCFAAKTTAAIGRRIERLEAQGGTVLRVSASWGSTPSTPEGTVNAAHYHKIEPTSQPCAHAQTAVVVYGQGRGETLTVCADKKCKQHWGGGQGLTAGEKRAGEERKRNQLTLDLVRQELAAPYLETTTLEVGRRELLVLAGGLWIGYSEEIAEAERLGITEENAPHDKWGNADFGLAILRRLAAMGDGELAAYLLRRATAKILHDDVPEVAALVGVNVEAIRERVEEEAKAKVERKKAKGTAKAAGKKRGKKAA